MTKLWLVRHGQTDWNLAGRWQGQSPKAPGLNAAGRAQALSAREQLRDTHVSAIYSSDLLRARQTAELLAEPLGLTVKLEPRLREINLGAWEGMLADDIVAQYPAQMAERAQNPFDTRAPNGESLREVAERVLAATNEIVKEHQDESILLVAHGVSLAVIACYAEGFRLEDVYQHIPDNAKPYHAVLAAPKEKR